MIDAWMRRWAPWLVTWCGYAVLIFNGDIVGAGRTLWSVVFVSALVVSVIAGATRLRTAMNLMVASVVVIAGWRSYEYARLDAWGPLGVWLVVVGTHLLVFSTVPVHRVVVSELDCQRAESCPRRIPVIVAGKKR